MKKYYMRIEGMFCAHCHEVVVRKLMDVPSITKVFIRGDIAHILSEDILDEKELVERILKIGYETKEEYISTRLSSLKHRISGKEFLIIFLSMIAIAYGCKRIFGYNIFNVIPQINQELTYGMLLVTGFFTSIHCISMCGALNLTAVYQKDGGSSITKSLLYNAGRLISYTLTGAIIGGIGSVIMMKQSISGFLILISAVIMLLMSLQMMGVLTLPRKKCFQWTSGPKNAMIIGLLNGFMPCGPLQAMQLYALSSGNAFVGGLSMLLFGIGTLPVMLSIGFLMALMNGKWKIKFQKCAAVLIFALSIIMVNRGFIAFGFDVSKILPQSGYDGYTVAIMEEEYQVVNYDLTYGGYRDIVVQKDVPVKLIIHAEEEYITGCNEELQLPEYDIDIKLHPGDNEIIFTPDKEGDYIYACWMNMLSNRIKVIDDPSYFERNI